MLDLLVRGAADGITATGSGRFFGFVIGGALPAAVAADMMTTVWDQNAACGPWPRRPWRPTTRSSGGPWTCSGSPADAAVGLVPGGMSANFTCLAAARTEVLRRAAGTWTPTACTGAPRVHVLANADRHEAVDRALRFLGLGRPVPVATDEHGRVRPDALAEALAQVPDGAPLVVSLYAGHINTGAFDDFEKLVPMVRARGGWVHVDGAIGLWAGASPRLRHLLGGVGGGRLLGHRRAQDAQRPLRLRPGRRRRPARGRGGDVDARRLHDHRDTTPLEPCARTPEWSRRARGFATWAALRSLGRSGVADLVDGLHDNAVAMAEGLAAIDGDDRRQPGVVDPGLRGAGHRRGDHAPSSRRCWPTAGRGSRGPAGTAARWCGCRSSDWMTGPDGRGHGAGRRSAAAAARVRAG